MRRARNRGPNMNQHYPSSDNMPTEISGTGNELSPSGNCGDVRVGEPSAVATRKHDPKLRKAVGERIRRTRLLRGMKQTELAEAVGVKPHSMWRYEEGENQPNPQKLDKIAEALGVPHRWLVRGGAAPPGLGDDDDERAKPRRPIVLDPPITQEQQRELLDEIDASPVLRACWGLHRQGTGAFQRITRVYMSRFLEVAQQELDAHVSVEVAAEHAGDYAFNAAVEAHNATTSAPAKKLPRRT